MNAPVITDTINGSGSGSGGVATRLLQANFDVNSLRTNGVLRKDEWIQFDNTVIQIARANLVGVADLMSRGLTYPIANALGITRVEWERISDITPAEISMSGIKESENDRPVYDLASVPLPIFHKDFTVNIRALEASRRGGNPLDTTTAALAARKVAELMETTLFNGATVLGSNNAIYGYTTAPNRNTGSTTADWDTATGANIMTDVLAMIGKAVTDNFFGPYVLYVSAGSFVHMGDDFKAESDRTIMERVMAVPQISAIRPTKDIVAGTVLLIQMSSDVVDLVDGLGPTTVEWESHGGMVMHFKVLAIMVPRMKSDYNTQSGIVHYS